MNDRLLRTPVLTSTALLLVHFLFVCLFAKQNINALIDPQTNEIKGFKYIRFRGKRVGKEREDDADIAPSNFHLQSKKCFDVSSKIVCLESANL